MIYIYDDIYILCIFQPSQHQFMHCQASELQLQWVRLFEKELEQLRRQAESYKEPQRGPSPGGKSPGGWVKTMGKPMENGEKNMENSQSLIDFHG